MPINCTTQKAYKNCTAINVERSFEVKAIKLEDARLILAATKTGNVFENNSFNKINTRSKYDAIVIYGDSLESSKGQMRLQFNCKPIRVPIVQNQETKSKIQLIFPIDGWPRLN